MSANKCIARSIVVVYGVLLIPVALVAGVVLGVKAAAHVVHKAVTIELEGK